MVSGDPGALVTVAIVTWNSGPWIEAAIRSVPGDVEILVWDNDSSDDTVMRISRLQRPRLRMVAAVENLGFAAAMNRLIDWSATPLVYFMNPDSRFAGDALDVLVDWMGNHPGDVAAVPLLLGEDGEPQRGFQLRRLPTTASIALDLLLIDELLPQNRVSRRQRYSELSLDSPVAVEQPAAAAMLVRREALRELGGFDERFYPAWFEDVDLCRRMLERGMVIRLVPRARVLHSGASSLEALGYGRFLEISHRNLALYTGKWLTSGQRELIRLSAILGMLLRLGAALVRPRPRVKRLDAARTFTRVLRGWFFRWPHSTSSW